MASNQPSFVDLFVSFSFYSSAPNLHCHLLPPFLPGSRSGFICVSFPARVHFCVPTAISNSSGDVNSVLAPISLLRRSALLDYSLLSFPSPPSLAHPHFLCPIALSSPRTGPVLWRFRPGRPRDPSFTGRLSPTSPPPGGSRGIEPPWPFRDHVWRGLLSPGGGGHCARSRGVGRWGRVPL